MGGAAAPPHHRGERGLTILEMIVSTTMLSFIILGLTAVFVQVQKAFKNGIKQADMSDGGRTIMDMVTSDLRQMTDAKNPGVPNLFWSWAGSNQLVQETGNVVVRTNQQDEIFILVHTNNVWTGVGYAVSNVGPCLGTLYRFVMTTNTPFITNNLFLAFQQGVNNQSFGTNWHAVADGVIHLKLRAYDQNGNEPGYETEFEDYSPQGREFYYPPSSSNIFYLSTAAVNQINSNTLPNSVDLELAMLEPDAYAQAHALTVNQSAVSNFLATNAVTKVDVFHQRLAIPVVP
jgi:hypothetical protein